jgi:hypothetical protein
VNNTSQVLNEKTMLRSLLVSFPVILAAIGAIRFYKELKFFHKRRIGIGFATAASAILLFLLLKPAPEDSVLVRIPANFMNGASFDVSLNVSQHRVYYIDIQASYTTESERLRVRELIGEAANGCQEMNACGLATQVEITIKDSTGRLITDPVQTLFGPRGHYAHGSGGYWRNLGTVPLRPGQYVVTLKAIGVDERIHSMQVDFLIHPDPRGSQITE